MNTDLDAEASRDISLDSPAVEVSTLGTLPLPAHERWSKLPKPRGRQPRDPNGQSVRFNCRDVDELQSCLHDYLNAPTIPAEHATLEFVFPVAAAFMVYAADFKNRKASSSEKEKQPYLYGKLDRTAISVIDALSATENPKDQMRRQKAIAKVCVEAIEKADGFRYSFHNNWLSREDEACRFSYFCNDSTLNKGRAANEGAGMVGKKMRKAVYDCHGLIAVKFSSTKQSLEVHYKHLPLHKTYAERAPPPRLNSKRRKIMEVLEPENLPVSKRKRRLTVTEGLTREKPMKRRVTEPVATLADINSVGPPREDNLQHLVSFLDSTTDPNLKEVREPQHNGVPRRDAGSGIAPPTQPGDSALTSGTLSSEKPRSQKAIIPGTMAGSVQNGHLNWTQNGHLGRKAMTSNKSKAPSRTSQGTTGETATAVTNTTGPTLAEPQASASTELSELEALKRKLEEAEARIQRLESEKAAVPPPLPGPPRHILWPPPPGYPAPYPYHPGHTYPPPAGPPGQMHYPPHAYPPIPYEQPSTNASTAKPNTPTLPTPPASSALQSQSAGQRSKPSQPVGARFKFYTPNSKAKQSADQVNTPTHAAPALVSNVVDAPGRAEPTSTSG